MQFDPLQNPGDLGPISVTNISLTGSSPTIAVLQTRNGTTDQLFAPIPGDLLRLPVPSPDLISVKVNGAPASCTADDGYTNCTFAYSSSAATLPAMASIDPPTISFASPADVANVTISGSSFGASAAAVAVTIGRATCRVLAASDTQVTCQLAAAAARAGTRQVAMLVQGAGQATGNLTVDISMTAGGGPATNGTVSLAAVGITLVNISGNGFETDGCQHNKVFIGGVRCGVAACTGSLITAVFPGSTALGPAEVRVVVVDDAGAEVDAASYSVSNSTVEVAADAPSILEVAAEPSPLPASGGAIAFTLGGNTTFSSVAAAFLVPAFDLNVTSGGPTTATIRAAMKARLQLTGLTSTDGQNCSGLAPALKAGSYLLLLEGASGWQVLGSNELTVGFSISSVSPNQGTIGGGTLLVVEVSQGSESPGASTAARADHSQGADGRRALPPPRRALALPPTAPHPTPQTPPTPPSTPSSSRCRAAPPSPAMSSSATWCPPTRPPSPASPGPTWRPTSARPTPARSWCGRAPRRPPRCASPCAKPGCPPWTSW